MKDSSRKSERGNILLLVLATLFVGTILLSSSLSLVSTSTSNTSAPASSLASFSAAEAGAEHGFWRLSNEAGFADSLTPSNPSTNYNLSLNSITVPVTVSEIFATATPTPTPTPIPDPSLRITIGKGVAPHSALAYAPVTVTYTIQITNVGTSNVKLEYIADLLPPGFSYVPGTSNGVTTGEPVITTIDGRDELMWAFGPPRPGITGGNSANQVFQASANLAEGVYYNDARVSVVPQNIGDPIFQVYTGPIAPVDFYAERYDILIQVEGITIRVGVERTGSGVTIVSWEEQ